MKSVQIEPASEEKHLKVNMCYLWLYVIVLSMNATCVAWITAGNNQTSTIFAAKFDWDEG